MPSTADEKRVEELMGLFAHLTEHMEELESRPKTFDTGVPLHRAETHTLEAIGVRKQTNVTALAKEFNVTKGAISQLVVRLERKGLVRKAASPHSGREIVVELTELGWKGFRAHRRYHAQMLGAVRDHFGANPGRGLKRCIAAVKDLIAIAETFEARVTRRF